jgi:hypothetical protein
MKSELRERALHFIRAAGAHALRVKVFDPEQPAATVVACIKIAAKRGNQRSQMQRSGGRGGETADVGRGARGR